MKKFLLLSCIPLIFTACSSNSSKIAADSSAVTMSAKSDSTNSSSRAIALPELITLNGIPLAKADVYVSDFINNASVYKSATSIWFSKAYVNNIRQMLAKEGSDGIRIYFAKHSNGHNIVVVSTREIDGIHQDYFEHSDPFLKTAEANGVVNYTKKSGATLYELSPNCPINDNCNASYNHYLSCSEAAGRVKNFTNDKFATTSEWFDIGLLDNVSNELEHTPGADGIRIYYARNTDPKKNTHGFVITTTKTSATDSRVHEDYYTCGSRFKDLDNGEQCPNNCYGVTWPKPE